MAGIASNTIATTAAGFTAALGGETANVRFSMYSEGTFKYGDVTSK